MAYKTFLRSATSFGSFAKARKTTVDTGLTYDEARRACDNYNTNRTSAQIRRGTKMEFISTDTRSNPRHHSLGSDLRAYHTRKILGKCHLCGGEVAKAGGGPVHCGGCGSYSGKIRKPTKRAKKSNPLRSKYKRHRKSNRKYSRRSKR